MGSMHTPVVSVMGKKSGFLIRELNLSELLIAIIGIHWK